MPFPFIGGMPFPFQLGGNAQPIANINTGTNVNSGNDYAQGTSNVVSAGNGVPAQSICSWLSSFIKAKENGTNTETTTTNDNGETLQISNLHVNIKNPQQLSINQNQVPFGIVGFIPIIAVPNCQHNSDPSALPTSSIQIPNLCTQLTHLLGIQSNTKDANQPLPT